MILEKIEYALLHLYCELHEKQIHIGLSFADYDNLIKEMRSLSMNHMHINPFLDNITLNIFGKKIHLHRIKEHLGIPNFISTPNLYHSHPRSSEPFEIGRVWILDTLEEIFTNEFTKIKNNETTI